MTMFRAEAQRRPARRERGPLFAPIFKRYSAVNMAEAAAQHITSALSAPLREQNLRVFAPSREKIFGTQRREDAKELGA
ncbi:hypothetical protein [Sphingomonas pokkalii]|uniref:hypothetical protein n=1 Tax=Sphingomonas pokkalii TaxID=2175090 RepID=UPI001057892E|nr:hypothetical protein [Sphingomonas pokkalii]